MSHKTRTQNSGPDADPRRNNPFQYNLCPLRPQLEDQEGNELPPVVDKRIARHLSHRETRIERLEQCLDTLIELVSTLVAALDQNAATVAPAIPLGIPFANAEGEEAQPPQEDRDATGNEA